MKKIILSVTVLGIFALYAVRQQNESSNIVPIPTPPQGNSSQNQPTTALPSSSSGTGKYKDGTYTGDVTDAFYGNVQVQATILGGKITDVKFLQYPNKPGNTITISNASMPVLISEALSVQNAKVDVVTGATQTSEAFQQSLQSALSKAQG